LAPLDLQSADGVNQSTAVQEKIREVAEAPFNFGEGRFLRAELLRLAPDEHVLILLTHHIVSDAWSMGCLTRELWSLYESYASGKLSSLEELPVQYVDFALWQRDWLEADVLESQLSYWKKQLRDLPVLNLPTDRPRPQRRSGRGASVPIMLPESLTTAIDDLSHQCGVTPFMILLGAFQVLLSRYCGQEHIVIGSPVANRRRPELETLIGFFVNILVLRTDFTGQPTFKELLFRVREVCLAAQEHQDLPFEKLVQELQPERDQSRNPLFQVMFALQNATRPLSEISGVRIEPLEITTTRSLFDLSVFLRQRGARYIGQIEYSSDLFDHSTIERMAGHFRTLLEGIIRDSDQPVGMLALLTDSERQQILVDWNDTAAAYPKEKCIHDLFEEQAKRTPNAIAVEFQGKQLTYGKLNERANQVAHHLIRLGVRPETLVGICIDRSLEMVVGLLGILKAGGAYLPLDPTYPRERLRFILQDAQTSIVVTQEALASRTQNPVLNAQQLQVCLDRDWPWIAQEGETNPEAQVASDNLAYVIYTSGSTGRPKGVAIEHRNIVNLVYWAKGIYRKEELAGVLASTSICFDLSLFELLVPLCWGGKAVLVQNIVRLHEPGAGGEITLINTVPSALSALLSAGSLPASVHTVNLAGEPLRSELVKKIYDLLAVEKIYDLYGPSETTTYSTFASRAPDGPETIGRPIANSAIYILDARLQPVPVGVTGEIFIGGAGVARGYLNRPALTKERFVSNPFCSGLPDRLYRTGDLARYLLDGRIQLLGRNDQQVKIRGYRIELGEIEAALSKHRGVKECAVVAEEASDSARVQPGEGQAGSSSSKRLFHSPQAANALQEEHSTLGPREASLKSKASDERGADVTDRRLVAYYVRDTTKSSEKTLRRFLRERLPDYMIPSVFIPLTELPRTPNGKVDRNALPPAEYKFQNPTLHSARPRTEIEGLIAQTWRDVLQLEHLGIHDNFFELGGHSLLAIQIVARLREAFDREIPLKVLFDAPTVVGLSHEIETILREGSGPQLPPIVRVSRDGPLPLSMNQEHLWRLEKMIPGTRFFNMPYVYRLSGDLDHSALERALKEIIGRHEALRTVFVEVAGRPMQKINDILEFQLPYIDNRRESAEEVSETTARMMLEERQAPFDLASGPLMRTKLLRLTNTEWFLMITMHHIISDYQSMEIFFTELVSLYECFVEKRPSLLSEVDFQMSDYAIWERDLIQKGLMRAHEDYWQSQLAGSLQALAFYNTCPRKIESIFYRGRESMDFNKNLLTTVKQFCRQQSSTPFMVVVLGLSILLNLWTGQEDIRLGTLVANRARQASESILGYLANTVVLRLRLSPEKTIHELLREVRRITLMAFAHQEFPFELLARRLEAKNHLSWGSIFDVLLMYQRPSCAPREVCGLRFAFLDVKYSPLYPEVAVTTYPLILRLSEAPTTFTGTVNYRSDTFGRLDALKFTTGLNVIMTFMASLSKDELHEVSVTTLLSLRELKEARL
jgi:amino acid adenylation domain-containing protein